LSVAALWGGDGTLQRICSAAPPLSMQQTARRFSSPRHFFQHAEPALELDQLVAELDEGSAIRLIRSEAPPVQAERPAAPAPAQHPLAESAKPRELPQEDRSAKLVPAQQPQRDQNVGVVRIGPSAPKVIPQRTAESDSSAAPESPAVSDASAMPVPPAPAELPAERPTETEAVSASDESGTATLEDTANTTASPAPTTEPSPTAAGGRAGMSPRSLAIRYLTPSRFFQTGEPPVDVAPAVPMTPDGTAQADAYFAPPQGAAAETAPSASPDVVAVQAQSEPSPVLTEQTDPAPNVINTTQSGQNPAAGTVAEAEKLGTEPVNNSLQFLRTQAVLLDPGEWQVDFGLTYSVLESDFPTALVDGGGNVVGVVDTRVKQRQLTVPLAFRYGCTKRTQLFANVPVGWANSDVAFADYERESNVGGLGDIEAGISVQLKEATDPYSADVVATLSFTAPTGIASLPDSALDPADNMGEGVWSMSQSLLFIHTIDPVVVFYGLGYRHRFDGDIGNFYVNPGEEINYQFGTGFAVNPWVTLGGSVIGAHITELKLDDVDLQGSDRDPIHLRMSLTVVKGRCIIEPFAEVPMTNDASSRVGVIFTY